MQYILLCLSRIKGVISTTKEEKSHAEQIPPNVGMTLSMCGLAICLWAVGVLLRDYYTLSVYKVFLLEFH
jgi:hypothetical protein